MKPAKRTAAELAAVIGSKAREYADVRAETFGEHVPDLIAVDYVLRENPALAKEWFATPELRELMRGDPKKK